MFMSFTPVRIPRVFAKFTLFYKYTGGFRPWLIDFEADVCELFSNSSAWFNNKAFLILFNGVKAVYPSIFTGCPYEGLYETRWVDINASITSLLPPIIPTGVFRLYFHFYTPENETIFSLHADALLKSTKEFSATDFSFLNMG